MTSVVLSPESHTISNTVRRGSGGFRRLLLILLVIALPLEHHLPAIAGFSVIYIAFAILTMVALVAHPSTLFRCAIHPIFIVAYLMAAGTLGVELLHTNSDLLWWTRMAQMVAGGVIFASYLRSDRDINALLSGYIFSALWVAVLVIHSSYAIVTSAGVAGFHEASLLRVAALEGLGLKSNWNMLAMMCASGAAIAAARAILSPVGSRLLYTGVSLFLLLGTLLTFSRSGMVASSLALGYVFLALMNRKLVLRLVPYAITVLLGLLVAAPRAVFQRFEFSFAYDASGGQESRAHIYSTLIKLLPEYLVEGVGSGNYWSTWAYQKGLSYDGVAAGAHNLFLQVTAFWGLVGLAGWLLIFTLLWLYMRRASRDTFAYVPVSALLIILVLFAMLSNDIGDKQLSVMIGTVVGLSVTRARTRRRELMAQRLEHGAGAN